MRTYGSVLFIALLATSFVASAQDVRKAYNFSNLTTQGTARSMGFGNALGSVGGDFSSLSVNPAGLGIYRSSELTLTPSLRMNATSSEYTENTTSNNNTHFNFNNFGLVFTNAPKGKRYEHRSWKTVSFAVGMNRVADFNADYTYSGKNMTSSASQAFESDANQSHLDPTVVDNSLGSMGYQSYLLNQNAAGNYVSSVPFSGGVMQQKSSHTTGGIDEYTFSLGGNYKEKLMLGITIGVPVVNYHNSSYYSETLSPDNTMSNPNGFGYFNYSQSLDITGAGVNAKIGAIYKFNDMFRFGLAFHSPTYYSLHDVSAPAITTMHNDSLSILSADNGYLNTNVFDYNLSTPWKGVLSATIMLNKFGFITADYEYVDYSSMRYVFQDGIDNNGVPYQQEADAINQTIKKTYQGASNFRLGGEGRISSHFMARVGFGYYGNAYSAYGESTANAPYSTQRIDVSAGVGFRFRHFFTDLGFVHSMYQGYEQPYNVVYNDGKGTNYVYSGAPVTVPTAKIDYALNNLALTVGVKF